MASFDLSIPKIILDEGDKYTDNPNDRGGPTKYGISLRFLKKVDARADAAMIQGLTREQATYLYRVHFWDFYKLGDIHNQEIADICFELLVNMAPQTATKIMQNAINAYDPTFKLVVDGILGDDTKRALSQVTLLSNMRFAPYLKIEQAKHYCSEVKRDPTQLENLRGWVERALR